MIETRLAFEAELGFGLDPFQVQALDVLDRGASVLVAAPTGSGKTVVAEYAVALALTLDQRVFYTSPLKALSNQKYADLAHKFGSGRVGLMTGDNVVRPDAPVVVMTTEILRNMIYERPQSLDDVAYVVLDEVHYLQDQYRGAVWEEVLIHCPRPVRLVCLSATVSNAEEFGAWMSTVRGEVEVIIEEERPIRLSNLYMVKDRGAQDPQLLETFVDGEPNRRGLARDKTRGMRHSRARAPRRSEVIQSLGRSQMLPAIYFIFSRAACDAAVKQCLGDGIRLNGSEDRLRMRKLAESHVESLSDSDLGVLGYQDWLEAAESGLASHHAGLVPPFKEAVEEGFKEGLIKVVFATETLSLGVNMPARAVVIEKLIKFNGRTKELLTAGEYTQLTGRAGRRGLDDEGFAVVLWSPQISFHQTAGLAGARSYALRSSFRPTYNMVANLVRRYPSEMAHELLNLSFAQYQTDALVVSLQLRLDDARRTNKESEAHRLARRLSGRKESLSKQLDTILDLLDLVGFVQGWNLTGSGYQLASIYHETDLLIAQCLGDGLLDSLDPPDLAGLVSVFTFESRQRSGSPLGDQATGSLGGSEGSHGRGRALGDQVWARWEQVQARAERLGTMERRFGLPPTRPLDPGLIVASWSWCSGRSLKSVLGESGLSGGDFVRNIKQLLDLVGQVALVAQDPRTRASAADAAQSLFRGIVEASSVLTTRPDPPQALVPTVGPPPNATVGPPLNSPVGHSVGEA